MLRNQSCVEVVVFPVKITMNGHGVDLFNNLCCQVWLGLQCFLTCSGAGESPPPLQRKNLFHDRAIWLVMVPLASCRIDGALRQGSPWVQVLGKPRPKFISLHWGEYSNDVTVKLDREFKQFGLVWVIKFGVAPGRKHEHRACIFDRVKVDNSRSTFFVVQEGFPINIQVALEREQECKCQRSPKIRPKTTLLNLA